MTLQELYERVLINSGQFQFSQDAIELNTTSFKTLVEICLGIYNGYVPLTKHVYKTLATRQYTFTDLNTPDGIPEAIVSIQPVRISGVVPYYFREYNRPENMLQQKQEFPFEYRKPVLTVPVTAEYDILAMYYHKLTPIVDSDSESFELKTITDNEDEFIDLVTAKFLIGLGRSRRAFTIQELPITVDAADLVSEGKELEQEVMEELKEEKGRWYLAWGG